MENYKIDDKQLLAQLSQACDGLTWLSETDSPWRVIYWQNETEIDRQTLLQHYQHDPQTKISSTTLDSWFERATTEQPWHDEVEQAEVKRYQYLYGWLTNNLTEIQVFLVGEVEIEVYILGKSTNSTVMGLSTKIVET